MRNITPFLPTRLDQYITGPFDEKSIIIEINIIGIANKNKNIKHKNKSKKRFIHLL
jgi:hypothetical protein